MEMKLLLVAIILFSSLWVTGCSGNTFNAGKDTAVVSKNEFPPSIPGVVKVNNTKHEMVAGGYKWEREQGSETQVVQTDAASPYQIGEDFKAITLEQNQKITIEIEENPELVVYLWNKDGREKEITLNENQITAPASKGRYIFEVLAKWTNGEVSYTFVAEVK
ncbi:hypothetical protein C8K15_11370 [Paenisporosarcina sp. OV554]|nr:hypothetical protein [Paenisporosarcina sp. OV554]PUB11442.1 hypothetical protein C8K15_11370 [Paenisporosarcina sp. OV554]